MSKFTELLRSFGTEEKYIETICNIIEPAIAEFVLAPAEINRIARSCANDARRIYFWQKKYPQNAQEPPLEAIRKYLKDNNVNGGKEVIKNILTEAPCLLFLPTTVIDENVKGLLKHPDFKKIEMPSKSVYLQAAIEQPRLLYMLPDTVAANATQTVKHPSLTNKDGKPLLKLNNYWQTALKRPQMLYQSPDTIAANITGVVEHQKLIIDGKPLFELEDYLNMALKKPQLFLQTPNTVVENITNLLNHPKLLDDDGKRLINTESYAKAISTHPALLTQNADTMYANIEGVINHPDLQDENGNSILSKAEYLPAVMKQASLFEMSPNTIVGNVITAINHPDFCDKDGKTFLTKDEYLKAALKLPSLFVVSANTVANNISGVVNHADLQDENGNPMFDRKAYLKAAVKHPSLFAQSPETISGHIKIIKDLLLREEICNNSKEVADFCLKNPITMVLGNDNLKSRYRYAYAKRIRGDKLSKKIIADAKGKMVEYINNDENSVALPDANYEQLYKRHQVTTSGDKPMIFQPQKVSVYGMDVVNSFHKKQR